ncbi:ATP-binding protein [Brevundimonas sp.]|uniref:hybrid sensor histidine kinase/response regulator n=1 Tax=Brevundimonas sp. TaxID=1871086 RepID=UPI00286A10BA|nr:ATP-binding protein [Brevundimonas sp.]
MLGLAVLTAAPSPVFASDPVHRDPMTLAAAVERRASATTFAQLEAFGQAALRTPGREGLNRLHHVVWTNLNQGDFERATRWNLQLAAAAGREGDARYAEIAHLNALTIRYDTGDDDAAVEMEEIARMESDWFVRAHATRIYALALMDQDRLGEGLNLLNDAMSLVPENDAFADTARAGLWEMTGIGLMKLNDLRGATDAFGRFEMDHSNPAYPRPDFDAVYNLARMAVQVGDQPLAERLFSVHRRLAARAGVESLTVYDANLCAMVAQGDDNPYRLLRCLAPYGESLGAAQFLAPHILPLRAMARARIGDVDGARRDVAEIHRRQAAGEFREEGVSQVLHAEAELLQAQGRSKEAFELLRRHAEEETLQQTRRFSDGIGQVTLRMRNQLRERRQQLETARANTELQADVIQSQRWIVGIGVVFLLSAAALLYRQWRMTGHLRFARRRSEDANRAKSEFLANMSHEIRTPLNGVVAMADALSRRPLDTAEHEMVEIIRSSAVTLERLLSDILDSAKIEAGQVTVEAAPFALGHAVKDIAALWGSRVDGGPVALVVELDPALDRMVVGDVVRVRQILANLVSNALKFTSVGAVTLSVEPVADDRVRFTVTDTGVGFDAEQKARIFTRFQQADGSITRRFGGTGLGLAISRDLAELMGGELDCESTPGEGSRFWFELPLPAAVIQETVADATDDASPEGLRILLADDHPANRKVIEVLLAPTGATLIAVENGQAALDAFAEGGFDLILMDMQMPVMDGLTATAAIRAREAERGLERTPLLMLTANAMAEHVEAGRAAGADGHLTKPVTTQTLFAAIGAALDAGDAGELRAA